MATAAVGADVESICTKCGDVWHVVVAKVGDKIARVHCKECHREHRYKPPGGVSVAPAKAAGVVRRAPSAAAAKKAKVDEPSVKADLSKPERPYKPTEAFAPGERIAHATFGSGVVESSPGPGKIQVFFPAGRKILAVKK
jgi:hypothetical protein